MTNTNPAARWTLDTDGWPITINAPDGVVATIPCPVIEGTADTYPAEYAVAVQRAELLAVAPDLRDALAAIVAATGPDTAYANGRVDLDLHAAVRNARALLAAL